MPPAPLVQIINVFLVTTVANSILDTISEIVEEPTKTFTLLGEALPKVTCCPTEL